MNKEELMKKAFSAAISFVKKQIEKDQNNRYSLLAEWKLPTINCSGICDPFSWEGEYFRITKVSETSISIIVKPYHSSDEHPICDGCSLSPDLRGCIEGAIFHDPWYIEMEQMSKETGISVDSMRKLGDVIFANIAKSIRGDGVISRVYYSAVRFFGGIYHSGKKHALSIILAIAVSLVWCAGCSGCAIPEVFEDDFTDGNIPNYQKSND